ncbi:MAG: N-6 DNA methylase [Bacteroidales bacterium]|nr:N-6 DNA methylase [Bacteroidales bacterium]
MSIAVSETITENLFREFYGVDCFIEKSAIPESCGFISKKSSGHTGYPDFYKDLRQEGFVIIVEAKAVDFEQACREVRFYMENNTIDCDKIGIAISGQDSYNYQAALFLLKDGSNCTELATDGKLLPLDDIRRRYRLEKYGECVSTESLVRSLKSLNKKFNNENIKDTERSLFFAGLMIALKDPTFIHTYRSIQAPSPEEGRLLEAHNLNNAILDAIVRQISGKTNNLSKEYNWKDRFSFIKNIDFALRDYVLLISEVEENVFRPFRMDEKQDILGRAYKIFLSRAGKVENKNIILTPDHIKELMVELARLDVRDVVLDTCTGSGGFLMEAMEVMIKMAKGNGETINRIKEKQLVGFEIDPTLFALACSNMFLHGDGRTNLVFGSSLAKEGDIVFNAIRQLQPTKCIINPPYENNAPIEFTIKALQYLEPNGKLIVIMPTPTLNKNLGGKTEQVLKMAKLDFVIKMPNNLFAEQQRSVNTSIFGFTKTPHNPADKVIFYNMEDDGHVSVQHKGRVDKYGRWPEIKKKVTGCILHGDDVEADYRKKLIYDGDILNCYGLNDHRESKHEVVRMCDLFTYEKGSLASSDSTPGDYDFITASEEWKTNADYDHDEEALVYAVAAGGSLGRCHYVNGKFVASNLCIIMTPREASGYPLNLQFYSLYLNAIRKQVVNDLADGTSKPTINPGDLMQYYVEYFPVSVQDRIVKQYHEKVLKLRMKLSKEEEDFSRTFNEAVL